MARGAPRIDLSRIIVLVVFFVVALFALHWLAVNLLGMPAIDLESTEVRIGIGVASVMVLWWMVRQVNKGNLNKIGDRVLSGSRTGSSQMAALARREAARE